jgi:hypothetical protein
LEEEKHLKRTVLDLEAQKESLESKEFQEYTSEQEREQERRGTARMYSFLITILGVLVLFSFFGFPKSKL